MDAKKLKLIASSIVIILLGIVVFQNFEQITIKILVARITMPLAILLLVTFFTGAAAGWLASKLKSGKPK